MLDKPFGAYNDHHMSVMYSPVCVCVDPYLRNTQSGSIRLFLKEERVWVKY